MVRGMHLAGQRCIEGGAICFNVQGLGASWSKHKKNAELLWEGLEKLGLELLVKDKVGITATSLSCVGIQKGMCSPPTPSITSPSLMSPLPPSITSSFISPHLSPPSHHQSFTSLTSPSCHPSLAHPSPSPLPQPFLTLTSPLPHLSPPLLLVELCISRLPVLAFCVQECVLVSKCLSFAMTVGLQSSCLSCDIAKACMRSAQVSGCKHMVEHLCLDLAVYPSHLVLVVLPVCVQTSACCAK